MSSWRVGRSTGRTLWRDEQLVGMVDSPEIAAEIVKACNVADIMQRTVEPFVAVRAEVCGACLTREDVGIDGRFEAHVNSSGRPCSGSRRVAP